MITIIISLFILDLILIYYGIKQYNRHKKANSHRWAASESEINSMLSKDFEADYFDTTEIQGQLDRITVLKQEQLN